MNEWLKPPKIYLSLIVVLVVAIVTTHYIDSKYYNNQITKLANQNLTDQTNETGDFQNLLSQAWSVKVNCSYFKFGYDKSECQTDNTSKQEDAGKPLGQLLPTSP